MKKVAIIAGIIIVILIIITIIYIYIVAPKFIGRGSKEGKILKKYIDPAKLKELTENPQDDIWIIDIRTEATWKKGHIPTSRNFSGTTIESRLDEIPKDKYLIIYCSTGGQVEVVVNKLKKHGYKRYMNWGGFHRWPY